MLSNETLKVIEGFKNYQKIYYTISKNAQHNSEIDVYKLFLYLKFLSSKIKRMVSLELFGPNACGVYYETKNGQIISDLDDSEISNFLGFENGYGLPQLNSISCYLKTNDILYVLGAHIGTMLVPLSKKCKYVYGFEPNPISFNLLMANMKLNNINNATIFKKGTFYKDTTLSFLQNKANSGASKIKPRISSYIYNYDNPNNIKVEVVNLDKHISNNNLKFPDFLIIDVEGAEYFSLLGAKESLKHCRVLFIEFTPHHIRNVANVKLENFTKLILTYFNNMQLLGEDNYYRKGEIQDVLNNLFENNISNDLIFFKNIE